MKYSEYETKGLLVLKKLEKGEMLTEEDRDTILDVMTDPLGEFVKREAPFRLCEILNMENQEVDEETLDKAEIIIRDGIDNCEALYDRIDDDLRYELGN